MANHVARAYLSRIRCGFRLIKIHKDSTPIHRNGGGLNQKNPNP